MIDSLESIASDLANDLETERTKWFAACIELMRVADHSLGTDQPHIKVKQINGEPDQIIKSFQFVHVLSFINMQKYVGDKIGDLTRNLCNYMFGVELDQSQRHIKRYSDLKERYRGDQFREQFLIFTEDLALAITQAPIGMLLVPAIDSTVVSFYYRSLLLAAIAFDDVETGESLLKSIRQLHERR